MTDSPGRVLALLAHPDDAEFLCAGTLALLAQRGWHVVIATATPGDCGSASLPPAEIAAIRRAEAAAAAAVIGAEYCCLEGRDLALDYSTEFRRRYTEAVRQTRPTVVLTHPLADYMADHEIVGRLVRDACFAAPMPNFRGTRGAPPLPRIPYLYYCEPFQPEEGASDPAEHNSAAGASSPDRASAGRTPADRTTTIDISAVMETKRTMLAHHASQREWLQRQHGVDEYLRLQDAFSRRSGAGLVGSGGADSGREVLYGERFRQHRGHPYPQDDLLARLIGCDAGAPASGTSH